MNKPIITTKNDPAYPTPIPKPPIMPLFCSVDTSINIELYAISAKFKKTNEHANNKSITNILENSP